MSDDAKQLKGSFASALGGVVSLIARDLGAAMAVVGGLWAGCTTIMAAERSGDYPWPLYLVGSGIFVALVVVCRWRSRA